MAFDIETLITAVQKSRRNFLAHLKGLRDDQWDWKPYPECKSICETLAHLIADDRATVVMLETGEFPDFGGMLEREAATPKLLDLLAESHENLCAFLRGRFADTPLDGVVKFFGGSEPLGLAIAGISSEDYYYAGQVAFIRMATDPAWDYYKEIYGGGVAWDESAIPNLSTFDN